jgi:DNA polymerase III subunit gamma/tau
MNARRDLRWLFWPLITGHCLLLLSGCTRAHAKTVPQLPDAALDVPAPPERDIEPVEVEAPPTPQAPAPAPESPRTQPPRPRPAPAREQPKTEPPKPEPTPPVEAPKPVEESPRGSPTSTLQTTPATVEGELERGVRATLTRATNELNRIDYRVLNADAKIQYDTAKRFIRQADDAVKTKNLVFAKNLADKAATIADQLAGR